MSGGPDENINHVLSAETEFNFSPMRPRNLINAGLAVVLVALITLIAYEPGKEKVETLDFISDLKPSDIKNIVIEKPGSQDIILFKTNNQWQMSNPYKNNANNNRINKLLELSHAKSHSQYPVGEINLDQLKLSSPDLSITFNDRKFIFGTTDAIKGYRYIQINNSVYLITDRFSHLMRGNTTNLLSPALISKNSTIKKLVLPGLTIQSNDTDWTTKPDDKFTGADHVQQFLDEWRYARAIRVSKINTRGGIETNANKNATIKVYTEQNKPLLFYITQTNDEIILRRPDTGMQYHFTVEAGERLLKPQSTTTESKASS